MIDKIASPTQTELWNGPAGETWVAKQGLLDGLFEPVAAYLADAVEAAGASRLLDVGCGTGATTLGAARRLGPTGSALGIDLSAPMIARARERAAAEALSARFAVGDAETHDFAASAFDMAISRFGVMFFADSVRAFANLRRAMVRGGRLHAIAWRSAEENPFMTAAERAARPLLPAMLPRDREAPGQFAFADSERVLGILRDAGWSDSALTPIDFACSFPKEALAGYVAQMGPLGLLLAQIERAERDRIVAAVLPAFGRYVDGDVVRITAACWSITARA